MIYDPEEEFLYMCFIISHHLGNAYVTLALEETLQLSVVLKEKNSKWFFKQVLTWF